MSRHPVGGPAASRPALVPTSTKTRITLGGSGLSARDPSARYTSFDYCFNRFQQHRSAVEAWGGPTGMEVSCLQFGRTTTRKVRGPKERMWTNWFMSPRPGCWPTPELAIWRRVSSILTKGYRYVHPVVMCGSTIVSGANSDSPQRHRRRRQRRSW